MSDRICNESLIDEDEENLRRSRNISAGRMGICETCDNDAKFSILVAGQKLADGTVETYYLPNQIVRRDMYDLDFQGACSIFELWFCPGCIKKIEDSFRATILCLKTQNEKD